MKISVEYNIGAREIPEIISGLIGNAGQFYDLYNHVKSEETSKTNKEDKSPFCEYYVDTQTHKVCRVEDIIYKLIREGKIQPDVTR